MQKYFGLILLFLILFISFSGFSQEKSKFLKGSIRSAGNDVSNILIINLNSKKSTITDSLGLFTIEVKLKDSLRISAVQYLTKEVEITHSILNEGLLILNLIDNVIDLNEVTVMPYNLSGNMELDIERLGLNPSVNSSSLGLPNSDLEVMSQSERLLLEADRGKYVRLATTEDYGKVFEILGYATLTVVINTHKIMNRVSGRTKSLEEMVARDETRELENEIITKFSKSGISESFGIPKNDIDGFLTYCMSQKDFNELSNTGNSMEVWEYLKAKSIEFKQLDFVKQ